MFCRSERQGMQGSRQATVDNTVLPISVWITLDLERMLATREHAGTAGSKIVLYALALLVGYAGNWHAGDAPPRSDRKTQFRRNYFISWLDLDDHSSHCSAGYSIFGTTAS